MLDNAMGRAHEKIFALLFDENYTPGDFHPENCRPKDCLAKFNAEEIQVMHDYLEREYGYDDSYYGDGAEERVNNIVYAYAQSLCY